MHVTKRDSVTSGSLIGEGRDRSRTREDGAFTSARTKPLALAATARGEMGARHHEAVFAERNHGASVAAAFCVTNFVLEAATRIGGIKLRTARDLTPRVRAASTFPFTRTTGRHQVSKRAKPSRLIFPPRGPARLRENLEGCNFCEDQGGPQ